MTVVEESLYNFYTWACLNLNTDKAAMSWHATPAQSLAAIDSLAQQGVAKGTLYVA